MTHPPDPRSTADHGTLPVLGSPTSEHGRCGCGPGSCGCHEDEASPHPPSYWRSLAEYRGETTAGGPEFPDHADEAPTGYSRRDFVKLLGASAALAGLQGCERPVGRILPYVNRPPEVVPGVPTEYATTMTLYGYGIGLLAQSREGRPIKVEGSPDHPASLGSCGVFEQASILRLYDPHRGRFILEGSRARSWERLARRLAGVPGTDAFGPADGDGLRFLLEPTASPFRIHWIREIRRRLPGARFHFWSPAASPTELEGARRAFGRPLHTRYDFERAAVVVALDSNFLDDGPFRLRYAHDFADARRIRAPGEDMSRLYAAEPAPTPTGALADHRLAIRAGAIPELARGLAAAVEEPAAGLDGLSPHAAAWVRSAAEDLRQHGSRAVVVTGPSQPATVHALAHAINARLGSLGETARLIEPRIFEAGQPSHGLAALVDDMAAGTVESLAILDANPVYAAPADIPFADALDRVPNTLCMAYHRHETARRCRWYVPSAHYLETWGDARAYDGTLSTVQPLIRPLHAGRSVDQLLAAFVGRGEEPTHQLLRERWRDAIHPEHGDGAPFETFWQETLRRGVVPGSGAPPVSPTGIAPVDLTAVAAAPDAAAAPEGAGGVEVDIRPDPRVLDGRFANNAWLLELPDPVTKLTWENAALLAPATAERLNVQAGDVVRLTHDGRSLEIPALPVPGHAADAITLRLGYGREGAEETAAGRGVSAYRLRRSGTSLLAGVQVDRVMEEDGPSRVRLATTQTHWSMEGRPIVLEATLDEYRSDPDFTRHQRGEVPSLYEGPPLDAERQWGMTLDLAVCTGCSACVVACQAENNIPVVGRRGVLESREMHWLRVDRYLTGSPADPDIVHQPMLCQHCEKAPCEYVCPVNATVHSPDGLNEMVYQRCVGTRFCSNNCAWKVRRFNWFDYNDGREPPETLVLNPDVTVRERGVMEKCTYCVQRIRRTERQAQREGREPGPNEVVTACQQACPTNAITFGDITDPDSDVAATRDRRRLYTVLHELGTRPRTRYLARITNPSPALAEAAGEPPPDAEREGAP